MQEGSAPLHPLQPGEFGRLRLSRTPFVREFHSPTPLRSGGSAPSYPEQPGGSAPLPPPFVGRLRPPTPPERKVAGIIIEPAYAGKSPQSSFGPEIDRWRWVSQKFFLRHSSQGMALTRRTMDPLCDALGIFSIYRRKIERF